MDKLMVVDGSNLLFQMFYGMPSRIINSRGQAIQGIFGFVGALLKIFRMVNPTHTVVLFDGECKNERKDLDPDYKANRPDYNALPEEENPFSQLPDIYSALDFLGIKHCETTVCEADDWIAGYASKFGSEMDVVIVSQDSDFFQLITDKVSVLRYRGDHTVLCTPDYIREKLGITPDQYAAYKSLTGDHADNIRGIPRIGPKTAAALMQRFGDLDDLLSGIESIEKPSVRNSLMEHRDRLKTNLSLIALSGDVPLPFPLSDLQYLRPNSTTTQILRAIHLLP